MTILTAFQSFKVVPYNLGPRTDSTNVLQTKSSPLSTRSLLIPPARETVGYAQISNPSKQSCSMSLPQASVASPDFLLEHPAVVFGTRTGDGSENGTAGTFSADANNTRERGERATARYSRVLQPRRSSQGTIFTLFSADTTDFVPRRALAQFVENATLSGMATSPVYQGVRGFVKTPESFSAMRTSPALLVSGRNSGVTTICGRYEEFSTSTPPRVTITGASAVAVTAGAPRLDQAHPTLNTTVFRTPTSTMASRDHRLPAQQVVSVAHLMAGGPIIPPVGRRRDSSVRLSLPRNLSLRPRIKAKHGSSMIVRGMSRHHSETSIPVGQNHRVGVARATSCSAAHSFMCQLGSITDFVTTTPPSSLQRTRCRNVVDSVPDSNMHDCENDSEGEESSSVPPKIPNR